MNKGHGLELFVFELYKDLGYSDVRMDELLRKSNGTEKARAQIDLTYKKYFVKRYVECKYRTDGNVDFDDYAKFETTLKTFNIPTVLGEMVTNRSYDEKVRLRAKESRIRLIDRDELEKMNSKRNSTSKIGFLCYRLLEIFEKQGIKSALDYFILRNQPLENQIEHYGKSR